MQDNANTKKTDRRRWVRLVLVVSLALNLLFVGAVGSAFLTHGKGHKSHTGFSKVGGPLMHALSPEDKKKVRKELHRAYKKNGAGYRQYKQEKAELIVVLKSEPFDVEAARKHMDQMHEIVSTRLLQGREVLLERLAKMSTEERKAFAERLQKKQKKYRKD